jgi:hypothetical protein
MKASDSSPKQDSTPDQRKLTRLQAKRVAALADVDVSETENQTIAQLAERLKWKISPELFLFRRICGRVVKKDPVTGAEYPVPFATVYVEDTDCRLISYFPWSSPWAWHFPFFCTREVIATTRTDKCGNFCVWVPRFDIDWILRWRLERVCYPIIFQRPSLADLIPRLPEQVAGPWPPIPDPDPGPLKTLTTLAPSVIEAIVGRSAGVLAQRIARLQTAKQLGAPNPLVENLLQARAFETNLPPPLTAEFRAALSGNGVVAAKGASAVEGIRSTVALKLGLDPESQELAKFNPRRFIGPFLRCYDAFVPEWQLILDVPDITFRVGQDVNGDGTEETIYSEGYFDVRWDAGPLPDVTLIASPIARETRLCDQPSVQCGDVPALLFAGFMPLDLPTYFDGAIPAASPVPLPDDVGYMLRTNRPSIDGVTPPTSMSSPPAQAPFCEAVPLYGCVNIKGAKYYRILQSLDAGASFTAINGLSWNNYRNTGGTPIPIQADANGWYLVDPLDASSNLVLRQDLEFPNLLLDWPTPYLQQVILKVEVSDAAQNLLASSERVAIQTDNTPPTLKFTVLKWKFATEPDSALRDLLGAPCPTIHRGATPRTVELIFEVNVSAHHLRDASINSSGCGSGQFAPVADSLNKPSHWYTSPADNTVLLHQRYSLSSTALEGAYTFSCTANSRAVNPDGTQSENLVPPDWNTNVVYIYSIPSIGVAVVNAD